MKLKFRYPFKFRLKLKFRLMFRLNLILNLNFNLNLGSVVQRLDRDIHWIAIFSTFAKLAVAGYNPRLRFGIDKLKLLRYIVVSRSVVSQLFG